MAIKSIVLLAVVMTFAVSFCTSMKIPNVTPAICALGKLGGIECTQCNFLTFGQDEIIPGVVGYFCPHSKNLNEKYCCYGPTREPFCCDQTIYIVSGIAWLFAVILVIAIIARFIKYLIS